MDNVQKSDVLDALQLFKQRLDESGNFSPIVLVTTNIAETLTVSDGTTTLTAAFVNKSAFINLPSFGNWTVTVSKDERTRSVSLEVDTVKIYELSIDVPVRYGYRISKTEADPDARVEYLYDAVGMTPAHMVFDTDTNTAGTDSDTSYFDYGDWQNVWFVKDNKPCMLKYDGTVDYYLDPNDYSKKEDGSASDVANTSYGGNAMAQFPLCWVYRYEDDDYYYEIVSNVQWDENYKAYAHMPNHYDHTIKPYFYVGMFAAGYDSDNKLRSLSGMSRAWGSLSNANGKSSTSTGWLRWLNKELIRTLLMIISKSCDSQAKFGADNDPSKTGLFINKGQFYGPTPVKIFHIENFWASGFMLESIYMYPQNQAIRVWSPAYPSGKDYPLSGCNVTEFSGFFTSMTCDENGMVPKNISGASSSTYFCDTVGAKVSQITSRNPMQMRSNTSTIPDGMGFFGIRSEAPEWGFSFSIMQV